MPLALLVIGAILILTAVRGTSGQLGQMVVRDMTGSQPFLAWIAAIAAVGLLGYSPALRTPSRLLLGLIFVGMFLAGNNRGFFAQFAAAVKSPPAPTAAPAVPASEQLSGSLPVTIAGGASSKSIGGLSGVLGPLGQLFGGASAGDAAASGVQDIAAIAPLVLA